MVQHKPSKRIALRDPLEGWWMPPDERIVWTTDAELEDAVSRVVTTCCEDEIDTAVVETIFIANLSLRKAQMLTGIPKTTIARRRDILKTRLSFLLEKEPSVQNRLITPQAHQKLSP